MSILTEKEREDVYKYWLHSSTLTNEDGLIQLAEKALLEKLAGMELSPIDKHDHPEPRIMIWTDLELKAIEEFRCQAYAQGAASQLSAEPFTHYRHYDEQVQPFADDETIPLYTLKEVK